MRADTSQNLEPAAPLTHDEPPIGGITEFVRPAQVWKELGCSHATGWRLVKRGVLHKPLKIGPNTTVFVRHKLEADKRAMLAGAEVAA